MIGARKSAQRVAGKLECAPPLGGAKRLAEKEGSKELKKHTRRDNRRRKKTVAQRKAARMRHAAAMTRLPDGFSRRGDEREFLLSVLQPIEAAIAQTLAPHLPDLHSGDDDVDEVYDEIVAYALDLIFNNEDEDDPYAAVIRDVYRDGAEAALPHLERAIQWNVAFERRRPSQVPLRASPPP